jgi:hypothetical protein
VANTPAMPLATLPVRRPTPSADRANEAAALYIAAANRNHPAGLQPHVWNFAQSLVEIEAVVRWCDLVGRNVIAQLGIVFRIFRIPWQILSGNLPFDQFRILRQKKNSPLQANFLRPLSISDPGVS